MRSEQIKVIDNVKTNMNMNMKIGLLGAGMMIGCAMAADPVTKPGEPLSKAEALITLPPNCNTTDGMCLLPDKSFLVSIPNFNDEKDPPMIMRVTKDRKAEVFHSFPTPYPGLPDKLNVADSAANAVQVINPDGSIETLAQNGDVADKTTGQLDQPC